MCKYSSSTRLFTAVEFVLQVYKFPIEHSKCMYSAIMDITMVDHKDTLPYQASLDNILHI